VVQIDDLWDVFEAFLKVPKLEFYTSSSKAALWRQLMEFRHLLEMVSQLDDRGFIKHSVFIDY